MSVPGANTLFTDPITGKPVAPAWAPVGKPTPPLQVAPPNPATQNTLGGAHPFQNPAMTKFVQAKLNAAGYHVAIDGKVGPQTLSAYKAYTTGVHPDAWGEAYSSRTHPSVSPAAHVTPGVVPHGNPGDVPATTPTRTPAGVDPAAATDPSLIDPVAAAHAAANGAYDPKIRALARQIADAKAQEGATQGDIKSWYAKLVGDTGGAATANQATTDAALSGHDAAAAGLVAALGGSSSAGAADVAANATIGRTSLESLGQNNVGFDRNIGTAYAGEGVTALQDEHRGYASALKDNLAAQQDNYGAKGNAYISALQQARLDRTNQAKTIMDTNVEGKLSGVQVAQANANLASTKQGIKINEWRYQQGIKAAGSGGAGSVPEFTKQNPGQLSQLTNNLLNGELGPKGNFNQDPKSVLARAATTLAQLSYGKWDPKTNPAARQFITQMVGSRLDAWNRQNPQNKYALQGGQLISIK